MFFNYFNVIILKIFFKKIILLQFQSVIFFINMGVRASLHAFRLILRALKLKTI